MKQRFHALITACLVVYLMFPVLGAIARTSADDLMGFGMPAEWANFIATKLVAVNSSGNLVLPAATSKKVSLQAGGTEYASVNSSGLTTTAVTSTGAISGTTLTGTGALQGTAVTATTGNITATLGEFVASASGKTVALQEATAGDACMGTLTCNGASDVVTSTTCATTGSRIFLTRTSLDADTTGDFYVKSISSGTSFTVACETSDTGTLNWIIFHEAA